MTRALFLLLTLFSLPLQAAEWQDSEECAEQFTQRNLYGTFVLYDAAGDQVIGHNRTRAQISFIPDTTFEIPHVLIGLGSGMVRNADVVLPYGGQPQPVKAWEQNMSLRDAVKFSNVAIFQELARRVGLKDMRVAINSFQYGNGEIGNIVDDFWLVGPLKISALEQVEFLTRFGQLQLPLLQQRTQVAARNLLFLEYGNNWALYGKTGWATTEDPKVGWWVGWVQKGDAIYSFALNIDMPNMTDGPKRIELGKACLKVLGVLPPEAS
jgi:beta-lactamase class D